MPARPSRVKGTNCASPVERRGDVQRRRRPLGVHIAPADLDLVPVQIVEPQIGGDPGRAEGIGDARLQVEPPRAAEIAAEVAAPCRERDRLGAMLGHGAGLELDLPAQLNRQQRRERSKLLDPAGERAVDQRALEIERQIARDPGLRRAQRHVGEPQASAGAARTRWRAPSRAPAR